LTYKRFFAAFSFARKAAGQHLLDIYIARYRPLFGIGPKFNRVEPMKQ
jgi:hypothetical protein